MILRRVIAHFKKQEWTAIALDFLIVVVGVLLAIQIGNWNTARSDRADYERALERLSAEIETNLTMLDSVTPQIELTLENARQALNILQSCIDSEENRKIVNAGIAEFRGTYGIRPRSTALIELTSNPRLLAQQSDDERARFTDMLFYYNLMRSESDFAEFHPLEGRATDNPIIEIGPIEEVTLEYFGTDWTKPRRTLHLNVPLDEACHDNRLIKSLYTWEAWQDNLPPISRQLRKELETTKSLLEARK